MIFFYYPFRYFINLFYSFHCLSLPFLRDADSRKGTLCPFCDPIHKKKRCPCSYYVWRIKLWAGNGQKYLIFELLPVCGSYSVPAMTLNSLSYSDMSSSLTTHLAIFNTVTFIATWISFLILFIVFVPYALKCTYLWFLSRLEDLPVWPPVPSIVGCKESPGSIMTIDQVRVGTHGSNNGPTHDPSSNERLSFFSVHFNNIHGLNTNFPSVEIHLVTSFPPLQNPAVKSVFPWSFPNHPL